MVKSEISETESSGEFLSSLPSNTGAEENAVCTFGIQQTEVTSKVNKQRELVTDSTTHITDVGFKDQCVSRNTTSFGKSIVSTKSEGQRCVRNHVTNFRSDFKSG